MRTFTKQQIDSVVNAKTEAEKVKAAATAMIETPMELIRAILLKHEQAVIEVMSELEKERDRARELLERCENEMRYAGWTKYESDNPARNGVYEDVKEFLK